MILNEISGGLDDIRYTTLLAMFDPYTMQLPVKGGFVQLRAKLIILTSNLHIDGTFRGAYNQGQLKRRMTLGIIMMPKQHKEVKKPLEYASAEDWEAGKPMPEQEEKKEA